MVRIEIKRNGNNIAILISFDMNCSKFGSNYERNKFFRGLYGWDQIVRKGNAIYHYHHEGVMDEMPFIKVDNSVFIVALQEMQRILDYFEGWDNKITWKTFRVLLGPGEANLLERKMRNEQALNE